MSHVWVRFFIYLISHYCKNKKPIYGREWNTWIGGALWSVRQMTPLFYFVANLWRVSLSLSLFFSLLVSLSLTYQAFDIPKKKKPWSHGYTNPRLKRRGPTSPSSRRRTSSPTSATTRPPRFEKALWQNGSRRAGWSRLVRHHPLLHHLLHRLESLLVASYPYGYLSPRCERR